MLNSLSNTPCRNAHSVRLQPGKPSSIAPAKRRLLTVTDAVEPDQICRISLLVLGSEPSKTPEWRSLHGLHGPADQLLGNPRKGGVESLDRGGRLDFVEPFACLQQARGDRLAILVDDPGRQADLDDWIAVGRDAETPNVDQELMVSLTDIARPQRGVSGSSGPPGRID